MLAGNAGGESVRAGDDGFCRRQGGGGRNGQVPSPEKLLQTLFISERRLVEIYYSHYKIARSHDLNHGP